MRLASVCGEQISFAPDLEFSNPPEMYSGERPPEFPDLK